MWVVPTCRLLTIRNATICALLASIYESPLTKTLVLTFFLTLVLGLEESVSMQSMTLVIYALRVTLGRREKLALLNMLRIGF